MLKNIICYFYSQISLFVIVIGAICFFLSNLLMREILSPLIYGQYSIIVTFFSLIYSFGILGTEQVFIRFSNRIRANSIETQKQQLFLITIISIFSSLLCTFFFKTHYPSITINAFLLFLSSFSMIGTMFLFTILRINTNFFVSQLLANFWKLGLFFITCVFMAYRATELVFFVSVLCIVIIIGFFVALFMVKKRINFEFNTHVTLKTIFGSSFHFFLSILSFTLLIFADRFIIESKFKMDVFGNFFYLLNFFLAPFSILQNYIGFKKLIYFKENFNKKNFIRSNQESIALGLLLSLFLISITYICNYFHIFNFRFDLYFNTIFLLLLTGTIRLYSSSISAAFEAKTSMTTLQKSNIYIVIMTIIVLLLVYFHGNSIEKILIAIMLLWCFRCFIYRKFLLLQMGNE